MKTAAFVTFPSGDKLPCQIVRRHTWSKKTGLWFEILRQVECLIDGQRYFLPAAWFSPPEWALKYRQILRPSIYITGRT